MEAAECGVACLGMVLASHGAWQSLDELRDICGASRDGTTVADIIDAAEEKGFSASAFSCEPDELRVLSLPQILFWDFDHFVVLVGTQRGDFIIHDPAHGRRRVAPPEFGRRFTGVTITIEPGPQALATAKPPAIAQRMMRQIRGSASMVAAILLSGVATTAIAILVPGLTRIYVDDYLVQGHRGWLLPMLAGLVVFGLAQSGLRALHQHGVLLLQTKLAAVLSARFIWRLLHLPGSFFERRSLVEVAGRTQLAGQVAGTIAGPVVQVASNIVAMLGYLVVMFCYSPELTAVVVGLAICKTATLWMISPVVKERAAEVQSASGQAHATAVQGAALLEQVRATGSESVLFARIMEAQLRLLNAEQLSGQTSRLLAALPYASSRLTTLALLGAGALLVIWTEMTLGALLGVLILAELFSGALAALTSVGAVLGPSAAALDRLGELLDGSAIPGAPASADAGRATGRLIVQDLSFGFHGAPPLLQDISLALEAGELVAIAGPSGCGKTCLAKLLAGLLEPAGGRVLYETQAATGPEWTRHPAGLGYVEQAGFLPGGPMRAALSLWNPDITTQQMERALADACMADATQARASGLDGLLGEGGAGFSGGERQRLTVARALAADPAVVVLDDATSALDETTELELLNNLRIRGATVILFTNRPSAIAYCDRAYMLGDGRLQALDAAGTIVPADPHATGTLGVEEVE